MRVNTWPLFVKLVQHAQKTQDKCFEVKDICCYFVPETETKALPERGEIGNSPFVLQT